MCLGTSKLSPRLPTVPRYLTYSESRWAENRDQGAANPDPAFEPRSPLDEDGGVWVTEHYTIRRPEQGAKHLDESGRVIACLNCQIGSQCGRGPVGSDRPTSAPGLYPFHRQRPSTRLDGARWPWSQKPHHATSRAHGRVISMFVFFTFTWQFHRRPRRPGTGSPGRAMRDKARGKQLNDDTTKMKVAVNFYIPQFMSRCLPPAVYRRPTPHRWTFMCCGAFGSPSDLPSLSFSREKEWRGH